MRIKNKDIIEIVTTMNMLAREKLPIRTAWRIETSRKALMPFFETVVGLIDQTKKGKALKNPDGSFILAKDKNDADIPGTLMFEKSIVEELNSEINNLLEEEVEVENISLNISDFPENLELTADSIRSLEKVIKE